MRRCRGAGAILLVVIGCAACGTAARSGAGGASVSSTGGSADPGPSFEDLSPADFVAGVDNSYFPKLPGMRWVYEGLTEDGLRRSESEVLPATFTVLDLEATVVANKDYLDGVLTEDNLDFFVQDKDGNVWYLGEEVANYENGELHDHGGSWLAGDDGNVPGIVMLAEPGARVGERYLQEHLVDCPRDRAEVVSVGDTTEVPAGSFADLVQTHDTSAVELDLDENKFYAPGVGLVRTIDNTAGDEFELVEFSGA